MKKTSHNSKVAALFAGIGGIERGLQKSGYHASFLCEIEESAQEVLKHQFPSVKLAPDIRELKSLPEVEIVAAGFPCQDLSQAGDKKGINGKQSSLVEHMFRLLQNGSGHPSPRWLVIENVRYMLNLDHGQAMGYLTTRLDELGYAWAYRVVDARSFGIPQRRHRVILVASKSDDPRGVLFSDDHGVPPVHDSLKNIDENKGYGFYWTEGSRGIGWAESSVPPIKGGSGIGIPSPPAIWTPSRREIGTIDLRDAERFQGFPVDWTKVAGSMRGVKKTIRWKLIGNAVCVPVARWLGKRLKNPGRFVSEWSPMKDGQKWPKAAWGSRGERYWVDASMYPVNYKYRHLLDFLRYPLKPLSARAIEGYLARVRNCPCRVSDRFIEDLEYNLRLKGN